MKKWTDRIGYILLIAGTFIFLYQYRVLILYASDHLILGTKRIVTITSKIDGGNKIVYEAYYLDGQKECKLKSTPTKKSLNVGDNMEVLVSPSFKIFMLGKIVIIPYLFSILVFFFLIVVSVISVRKFLKTFK